MTVALVLLGLVYFAPSIVGRFRHASGMASIVLVNLFLGWTFGFWALAMFWAIYRPVDRSMSWDDEA